MMKDRLTVQRDPKGGFYIVIDTATEHFDSEQQVISVLCFEFCIFEELNSMNNDLSNNIRELEDKLGKVRAARDKLEEANKALQEIQKFHLFVLRKQIDENIRLKDATANWFVKEFCR